ncbi:MAG: tetratricopeptide repeat protein [Xenococcaceae cyanobacterium MO_188.B19]|nr:tetratricopeptide repeat protein [Xenococcaceae cyanobacterium MO_188.B19]
MSFSQSYRNVLLSVFLVSISACTAEIQVIDDNTPQVSVDQSEDKLPLQQSTPDSQKAKDYRNRGNLYYQQGKLELAKANYNQAIALNPNDDQAYQHRGTLYAKRGKVKLAWADLNQAIALNPNNDAAYSNLGKLYYEQGKLDLALDNFNQSISLNPNNAKTLSNTGLVHRKLGNKKAAITNFKKAQQLYILEKNTAEAQAISQVLKSLESTP